jgi:hypothetical protein
VKSIEKVSTDRRYDREDTVRQFAVQQDIRDEQRFKSQDIFYSAKASTRNDPEARLKVLIEYPRRSRRLPIERRTVHEMFKSA